MSPDLFKNLPSEITTNILLSLSIRSIAISKCVCKPWLHLLQTDDFIKYHFAKSTPALAFSVLTNDSHWFKILELEEDELDLDHDRRYVPVRRFDFSREARTRGYASDSLLLRGSAHGLLLLHNIRVGGYSTFYICNPITREFCLLRCPEFGGTYGFGVSRVSGQCKAVSFDEQNGWYVYTLGTESWRLIEGTDSFDWSPYLVGLFVKGNLHWMVASDLNPIEWISCFDLETECFSRFTVPPLRRRKTNRRLYALRDSIGFCDESSDGGGIAIWMMNEYGDENSWSMEYVIALVLGLNPFGGFDEFQFVYPMKVFKNGDVLMLCANKWFVYYSNKTKTSRAIDDLFGGGGGKFNDVNALVVTPSMVSLKCYAGMENVISF